MAQKALHVSKLIQRSKGGDELGYSGLDRPRRNRDDHKKRDKCIEVTVVNGGKHPYHEEMVEEVKQVEEADANEHQSCLSQKIILNP
jgi:hypothetical protein